MSTYKPNFYGVDAEYIELVTRKARRERSKALWVMIQDIFPSVSDHNRNQQRDQDHTPTAAIAIGPAAV